MAAAASQAWLDVKSLPCGERTVSGGIQPDSGLSLGQRCTCPPVATLQAWPRAVKYRGQQPLGYVR